LRRAAVARELLWERAEQALRAAEQASAAACTAAAVAVRTRRRTRVLLKPHHPDPVPEEVQEVEVEVANQAAARHGAESRGAFREGGGAEDAEGSEGGEGAGFDSRRFDLPPGHRDQQPAGGGGGTAGPQPRLLHPVRVPVPPDPGELSKSSVLASPRRATSFR
jgi:hypothetical protein